MADESAAEILDRAIRRSEEQGQASILPTQTQTRRELGVPAGKPLTFTERNYGGLPIDEDTGAPGWVRYGVAARENPQEKLGYLNRIYGAGMARQADNGEYLVKILGDDGNPKELLINEQGLSMGDVAGMAAYTPETAGAMAAIGLTRKIPMVGKLKGFLGAQRDIVAGSVGQEVGGAAKDVAVRAQEDIPIDAAEIIRRREMNLPFDIAMGEAGVIVGKGIGKLISPLGPPPAGSIEAENLAAAKRLKASTGVEMPQSPADLTGSAIFRRTEATAAQLPGSSKYFTGLQEQKTAAFRKQMNRIMGLSEDAAPGTAIPSGESIGEEAVAHIKSKLTPVQEAIESSRNQAIVKANRDVLQTLEDVTGPARQIYPEKVGASVRQAAFDKREAFRAQDRANYEEALNLPGGRDRVFETPQLAKDAQKLIDSMPQKTDIAQEIAYDTYGNPISKTVKGTTPSKEFVPDNVVGKLKELASTPKEQRSLQDLISMRSEVSNAIAEGEAIPGRQTRYLTKIRDTLTGAMDEATKDNPALKAAFEKANKFHKENVGQFHNKYIARLFRDIEQGGGFINDEDILRNIGPTEYAAFKEFMGAKSPEFAQLKRGIVDELFNASRLPGDTLANGKELIKNLSAFYSKNLSIAEDVLGKSAGKQLQYLGEVMSSVESKVDIEALKNLVKSGDPLGPGVKRLVEQQVKLDELYRSEIVKAIGEGRLGESFNASDFVNRFFETASPKEIQSVVSQLADNPEVLENLRRKLIQKVLFEAQRKSTVADPVSIGAGDPLLPANSDNLRQVVGNLDRRKNLEMIMGKNTMDDLADLSKEARSSEMNERAFKSAGGMIAGSQVAQLIHGGILSYTSNYIKQKFASIIYANKYLRGWVSNAVMDTPLVIGGKELAKTKQGALLTTLIGSTPFLEAVADEFGQGEVADRIAGEQFIAALRRSVNMWESMWGKKNLAAETKQPTAAELLDQRIRQK